MSHEHARANAIDFAVSDIRQLIDGMEIPNVDGETHTILQADDLPVDSLRPIVERCCIAYATAGITPTPAPDPKENVRRTDPGTSREAAWSDLPAKGRQRRAVLDHFLRRGPMTDSEGDSSFPGGMLVSTFGKRRGELVKGGWLRDSGETRQSVRSNIRQIVWEPTPKADLLKGLANREDMLF